MQAEAVMSLGFANAGPRAGRREDSLRPIPGQPGLFRWHGRVWRQVGGTRSSPSLIAVAGGAAANVSSGGSYRPAELGNVLSRGSLGVLALGVVGLVAFVAYANRDQYANPFEK